MTTESIRVYNSPKLLNGKLTRAVPYLLAFAIGAFTVPSALSGRLTVPFSLKNKINRQLFNVTVESGERTYTKEEHFTKEPYDVYEYHTEQDVLIVPLSKLSDDEILRLKKNDYDFTCLDSNTQWLLTETNYGERFILDENLRSQPWYNAPKENDLSIGNYGQIVTYTNSVDKDTQVMLKNRKEYANDNATAIYGGTIFTGIYDLCKRKNRQRKSISNPLKN